MASNYTEIEERRTQLLQQYDILSPLDKCILQLFSVAYEPMRQSVTPICFQHTGFRDTKGGAISKSKILERLKALHQEGFLVLEENFRCHSLLVEVATRDAIKANRFEAMANAVQDTMPIQSYGKGGPFYFANQDQLIRQIRISFYQQNLRLMQRYYDNYKQYNAYGSQRRSLISLEEIIRRICNNPFDGGWLDTLPKPFYSTILAAILNHSALHLEPAEEAFQVLQTKCTQPGGSGSPDLQLLYLEQLILRGEWEPAKQHLEQSSALATQQQELLRGEVCFVLGEQEEAIAHFNEAHRLYRKGSGSRQVIFEGLGPVFYTLACLKESTPTSLQAALETTRLVQLNPHWLRESCLVLQQVAAMQRGDLSYREVLQQAPIPPFKEAHSIETLLRCLALFWVNREMAQKVLPRLLEPLYKAALRSGYLWLAFEAVEILNHLKPSRTFKTQADILRPSLSGGTLADLIPFRENWELSLQALTQLRYISPATKQSSERRLVWFIDYQSGTDYSLNPREQKVNAQGNWSRGRPVALKRLAQDTDVEYLTPQDREVCSYLVGDYTSHYSGSYRWRAGAIAALVGHPLVFWENAAGIRVDVVKGEPELRVQRDGGDYLTLQFFPDLSAVAADETVILARETPTRLKVVELSDDHRHIAQIIGADNRLVVPLAAEEQVLAAINAVSGIVTIQSDVGGTMADAEEVPANSIPHIHLLPAGGGLKVVIMARPFANGGPYVRPGHGGTTMIAEIDGKRLQTTRNLEEETQRVQSIIDDCPVLQRSEEEGGEWVLADPEECLELLTELHTLEVGDGSAAEHRAVLEWPEGERLRVSPSIGAGQFKLKIQQQRDWFAASGEIELPDGQVLAMQQLMELLKNSPGRFLKIGEGQFLALTEAFRKRLDEFQRFSEMQGDSARFHPLAAMALTDFVDEVGSLKADKHWKAHIKRLQEMQEINPQVPSTLQAELRDYQIDGFQWLARLAHWGVGACLADDMGLGKTLQALTLILTRAPQGPTLILAPTSVGMNWLSEAEKFAPTLNPIQFGGGDRQKLLNNLQPFDLVVCSYGLLQQEEVAEMLAKVQWETIVLDEAQAIKNMGTKRSQAAMSLQGSFKIITTGTPIENHLGELWNLFRFINPGLLGSLEKFNERFATPIERYQDKDARHQLRKLIQPFILRRTKSQVLSELPSRTEILLHVELSAEELAFYEALRRDAISRLADSSAEAGTKHLQVLAEIMKLRRACCNPRLVMPNAPVSSSKLELFGDVLEELLSNHHKALVFSQFVDHLHILRDYLKQKNIPYQYLDGSTPTKERKKRVDAFQAGEGDVFLISLKAGGTGLNLTAADYVLHMDPWWNPAVEDQASDRAHRIGQQRPVTIYRLVAKGTIEDKIVDLHSHKRDLADSLLEGTEMSGKMSTDELLTLISEG